MVPTSNVAGSPSPWVVFKPVIHCRCGSAKAAKTHDVKETGILVASLLLAAALKIYS